MIDSIILLGQKLSAYDVSATVFYSDLGETIDNNTTMPSYQIFLRDIQETDTDILKYVTLRLTFLGKTTHDKLSVSAFSEKYDKDKALRNLLYDWAEESNQLGYMQGPISSMTSEIESVDKAYGGLGNNFMRITIDINTLFLETR